MPVSRVSISTDLTLPLIPPLITWHDFAYVTPPLAGVTMCLEFPVTIMWPPGFALAQNKLSTTVFHKMMPIALDGHNCGHMIPHVTIPLAPFNTMLPYQILFSSRKMAFSSSKVKANTAQVACNLFVLLPMTCCANPVTLPNGTAITNLANNVEVGLTWADVLAGFLVIGMTMAADKFFLRSQPKVPDFKFASVFEKFVAPITKKGLTSLAKKTLVGLATSAARLLITGEGSVSVKVGSDYANVGVGYARTSDGAWSISASGQVAAPVPPTAALVAVAGKYDYKHNADGTTTRTASGSVSEGQIVGPGGVAAKQSKSSATTTDHGHEKTKQTSGSQVLVAEPGAGHQSNTTTTIKSEEGKPTTTEKSQIEGSRLLGDSWGAPL
jgi:hypothetical protein